MKPCRLGRPTGSITLFPNEEYLVIDCVLRILTIQHKIANFNFNATGSSSCLGNALSCSLHTRNNTQEGERYACNICEFLIKFQVGLSYIRNILMVYKSL